MKTKPNDFVTAIVSSGKHGSVVQGQIIQDKQCHYLWSLKNIEFEDYHDIYDFYYRASDDGRQMYCTIKILENEPTFQLLKIDPSTIDVPNIDHVPMGKICELANDDLIARIDIDFYNNLLMSPSIMYDLYLANGNDIDKAQQALVDEVEQEATRMYQAMTGAVSGFMDDYGIDDIFDEYGNKVL
jgi:hypothetical protein